MKTTVIYHSADFDGLFCREIARKFLGDKDVEYIGWNYGDALLEFPKEGDVYVLDLSPECFWESPLRQEFIDRLIWIDHHKTAMEKWNSKISGYRIDGVAACRLAWSWFNITQHNAQNSTNEILQVPLPSKEAFINREVFEPMAIRLAGEYDIWDKRDWRTDIFQSGLYGLKLTQAHWKHLLDITDKEFDSSTLKTPIHIILEYGKVIKQYQDQADASIIKQRSFELQ